MSKRIQEIIKTVVQAGGSDDIMPLLAIASRESAFNPGVKHRLSVDTRGAIAAWQRNKTGTGINGLKNNRWINDRELWDHGRGLYGMITGYHMQKIHHLAHPDCLHDPVLSTVATCRLVYRAVEWRNYGANDWGEVNEVWATGSLRHKSGDGAKKRRDKFKRNLFAVGADPSLIDKKPKLARGFGSRPAAWKGGKRGTEADQLAEAELFRSLGANMTYFEGVPHYFDPDRDAPAFNLPKPPAVDKRKEIAAPPKIEVDPDPWWKSTAVLVGGGVVTVGAIVIAKKRDLF